jgi:Leucine-rich repeat (LRR) protein
MIKSPVAMCKCIFKIVVAFVLWFSVSTIKAQVPLMDSLTLDTLTGYTNLQEALKNPGAVTKLVLRKQHLKSFPKEIFLFKNLQYLDLSKNDIKEIPDSIGTLTNLQYFSCFKSGVERLPKEIGNLNNLLYLNLNQNELEYLPPQIGNLEKLEILDLWSNNLSEYPPSLANLKSLRVLDLRAILMTDELQAQVEGMLPKAKVYMSPSCKCTW